MNEPIVFLKDPYFCLIVLVCITYIKKFIYMLF